MTKHLRFLMLFVVTIMCSRGGVLPSMGKGKYQRFNSK